MKIWANFIANVAWKDNCFAVLLFLLNEASTVPSGLTYATLSTKL